MDYELSKADQDRTIITGAILADLHSVFMPYDGQIPIGQAIFYDGKQYIFLECGRKFGKSELMLYCLYRYAMTRPFSAVYYIAPYAKQARELIWANSRLQNFLVVVDPKTHSRSTRISDKYIASINNTEARVTFKNGSFIKLDGADNYTAYAGINPHFIGYDEFKDFHPKFHEVMEPNLATYKAPLLIVGSPPETEDNQFTKLADSIKEDLDGAYFNRPTSDNPHIDPAYLAKMKKRLTDRREFDIWLREYEARRVKSGRNHIFPMFDRAQHVVNYDVAVAGIRHQIRHYDLFVTADPASTSCFAVLFTAIHKYTKRVTHLMELYTKDTRRMTARQMWEQIRPIMDTVMYNPEFWAKTSDEAAAWFANEVLDITEGEIYFAPTHKSMNKKENGISLIKDQMLYGFWECTDRCTNLISEIENYVRDDEGRIPKENDHLIDDMRYTNAAAHYSAIPLEEEISAEPTRRGHTIDSDLASGTPFGRPFEGNMERLILGEQYNNIYDTGVDL